MKHGSWGQKTVWTVETRTSSFPEKAGQGERSGGERFRSLLSIGLGLALVWSVAGCHSTPAQNAAIDQNAGDPADANMAPVSGNGDIAPAQPAQALAQNVQYQGPQQGQDYVPQQQAAPIERQGAPPRRPR